MQLQVRQKKSLANHVLSTAVPPSIHAGPRVMKVQVGHPVELPCVVKGFPKPVLIWTKDGRRYPVSPDGSLALTNVGLDDEGTYTCTATNTAGRDEAQIQLVVQGWQLTVLLYRSILRRSILKLL